MDLSQSSLCGNSKGQALYIDRYDNPFVSFAFLYHLSLWHNTGRLHSKESRFSGHDADKESDRASINTMTFKPPKYGLTESSNHGSMYLKMGAVCEYSIGSVLCFCVSQVTTSCESTCAKEMADGVLQLNEEMHYPLQNNEKLGNYE